MKLQIQITFALSSTSSLVIGEFKKWRRQRQRHKCMISLAEWGKIIVLHVRLAFWYNLLTLSAKWRREMFYFEVLTTTRALSSKSFILCLGMKAVRAKQAKVDFTYQLCTTRPTWNNRKPLDFTQSSSLLRRFRGSSHFSFLNSLIKTMSTIARATSENVNSQLSENVISQLFLFIKSLCSQSMF